MNGASRVDLIEARRGRSSGALVVVALGEDVLTANVCAGEQPDGTHCRQAGHHVADPSDNSAVRTRAPSNSTADENSKR
jgi:hypothetical protein